MQVLQPTLAAPVKACTYQRPLLALHSGVYTLVSRLHAYAEEWS
jgi:hypothetical protein